MLLWLNVNAKIRIAVHKDSCSSDSLSPSYSTQISIAEQLSNGTTVAELLGDSDFTQSNLANYDVVYLGCGGKDNMNALSKTAATAIVEFVLGGGGLVLSATTPNAFEEAQSALESVMPVSYVQKMSFAMCEDGPPLLTINSEVPHYITSYAITSQVASPRSYSFYVQTEVKPGWTSLANVSSNKAKCCLSFDDCDDAYCDPFENQGILVKEFEKGRVAYINFAFCGTAQFGPQNLRQGTMNQLFLNMFYWTSGKCKDVNDCNNHGACTGYNTCICEEGWSGEGCKEPICDKPCKNEGICIAPNTCSCPDRFSPPDCSSCVYPYYGEKCDLFSGIADPSFEEYKSKWTLSDSSLVVSTVDGIQPFNGSKMLAFQDPRTAPSASQSFILKNNGNLSPFISFYYRTSSSLASSTLQILMDGVVIWENLKTPVADWTLVRKSLASYSSDEGSKHTITIKATLSKSEKFYVDLVKEGFPECDPPCQNGMCSLNDDDTISCHCDSHHSGLICDQPVCGDGLTVSPEACDDGNTVDGDGCSSMCTIEDGWNCEKDSSSLSICTDICGDGRTMTSDPTVCDDGNYINGDGCSSTCKVEYGYQCTQSKTEKSVCTIKCGDGIILGQEVCDVDPSAPDGHKDGCSSDCSTVTLGWECSYDYGLSGNDCIQQVCGDGRRTSNEECDDGNNQDGDGCSSDCKIEKGWYLRKDTGRWPLSTMYTVCGDQMTAGEEECDGGYMCTRGCKAEYGYACTVDPETLKSTCAPLCGDGIVVSSEQCDDGNTIDGDGCSSQCTIEPGYHCVDPTNCTKVEPNVCGDGIIHYPESCDIGDSTSPGCINCQLTPGWACDEKTCHTVCGDGVLTEDEFCDCGGNNPFCAKDNGCTDCKSIDPLVYECSNITMNGVVYSRCRTLCGNGIKTEKEQCDDGNNENGDGCSSKCVLENGWDCDVPEHGLTVCSAVCGDRYLVGPETCDEGKETPGCINCQVQYGYNCDKQGQNCRCLFGDGLICKEEECDDGDPNSEGCIEGRVADGWECFNKTGPTSVCGEKKCGNLFVNSFEECDDGNTIDGDGCSSSCKIEEGFHCVDPDNCVVLLRDVCGDGIIEPPETCDIGQYTSPGCVDCVLTPCWECDSVSCHYVCSDMPPSSSIGSSTHGQPSYSTSSSVSSFKSSSKHVDSSVFVSSHKPDESSYKPDESSHKPDESSYKPDESSHNSEEPKSSSERKTYDIESSSLSSSSFICLIIFALIFFCQN